jgi:glycosyltransferase involved in cell wall biosynthesis
MVLLNNDSEHNRLSRAALEYANKTSWENVAHRHLEVYREYANI